MNLQETGEKYGSKLSGGGAMHWAAAAILTAFYGLHLPVMLAGSAPGG